jgi:arsenite-transporting ATPase
VASTLRSDATHFVIVTAPSPDALIEADHFVSELSRLRISLQHVVANRMPPTFGALTSAEEKEQARVTTGDLSMAHSMIAGLCEDAENAREGVNAFLKRTQVLFPQLQITYANEMPVDIHDMESIAILASQLAVHPS